MYLREGQGTGERGLSDECRFGMRIMREFSGLIQITIRICILVRVEFDDMKD